MNLLNYITSKFGRLRTGRNIGIGDEVSTPHGRGRVTGGCIQVKLFPDATTGKANVINNNGGNFTVPLAKVK